MKQIIIITGILIMAIIASAGIMYESGIAGKTGSPGETTCDASDCHNSFALNSGTGSITITSSNMTNWEYLPDSTYHISVTVSQTGANPFGFDFEALTVSNNTSAGTIVVTDASETQLMNATVSGKVRGNITHTLNGGATSNTHSFDFDWTAPATDMGYIKFYAAGNAANGDGTPLGDYIYSTSQVVSSPATVGIYNLIASDSFSVYPNPVQSNCNIHFASEIKEGKCDIQLYNIAGALVQSVSNLPISGNEITGYKIADNVTTGVYLMRIIVNENTSAEKVIVSKN